MSLHGEINSWVVREGGKRLDALCMSNVAGQEQGATFRRGVTFWHPVSEKGFAIAIKWCALYDSIFLIITGERTFDF